MLHIYKLINQQTHMIVIIVIVYLPHGCEYGAIFFELHIS